MITRIQCGAFTWKKVVDRGKSRLYTLVLNCVSTFQCAKNEKGFFEWIDKHYLKQSKKARFEYR